MKTAVVFDSAGTLLRVYRVAKDVLHGDIVENVSPTNMVTRREGCALVALRADSVDFLDGLRYELPISAYIEESGIGIDVICRASKCTSERIASAALDDVTATIGDIQDAVAAVKLKCKDIYYVNIGFVVDVPGHSIPYVLATGGRLFPGVRDVIRRLNDEGMDVYIASGDNRKSLSGLASELGLPDARVFDALSPTGKKDLVMTLKSKYDRVVMVGDGENDELAMAAADVSVLTVQQESPRPPSLYKAASLIVYDIADVGRVIEERLHNMDSTNK
jgi:soluble P-type ATPase